MPILLPALKKHAHADKAAFFPRFFKTGKGEYGEGDQFIGVTVPEMRSVAKEFAHLTLEEIAEALNSPIHEERLTALLILVKKYEKATEEKTRKKIVDFYFAHVHRVNNWDLVDLTAPKIVGDYFIEKEKKKLYDFAASPNLWKRRIAIVATYAFIRKGKLEDTFRLSELLLNDKQDLMHKACGWMLREAGKKDVKALETFLKKHHSHMPRTMLRYAIEKFPEVQRKAYLKGTV